MEEEVDDETQDELSQPIIQQQQPIINDNNGMEVNFLHNYNMNEKNKKLY